MLADKMLREPDTGRFRNLPTLPVNCSLLGCCLEVVVLSRTL